MGHTVKRNLKSEMLDSPYRSEPLSLTITVVYFGIILEVKLSSLFSNYTTIKSPENINLSANTNLSANYFIMHKFYKDESGVK